MKKITFIITFCSIVFFATAQKPFTQILNTKFTLNPEWKTINEDCSRVLAGDLEDIGMFSCVDGKELWRINFKQKYGKKSSTDWRWIEEKGLVKIEFKGDKKGETQVFYIDDVTMEAVADENVRTVKTKPSDIIDKLSLKLTNPNIEVKASYYTKWVFNGSAVKGNKRKVNISCNGAYTWSTQIEANLVASLCDNSMGSASEFFGNQLSLSSSGNKVFVIYEGLTCLDMATGKLLWQSSFDNSYFDFGLFKSVQTVGRADYPMVENEHVYFADLTKNISCIKKLDANTGNVVWQSAKVDKDALIPQILSTDEVIIARFGGEIITQSYIPNANNSAASVCKTELKMTGDFGIKVYDKANGKLLWETATLKPEGDKFSSSISNVVMDGKNIIVASDKNIFSLDSKTGKVNYKVACAGLDIGKPYRLYWYKDDLMIEANEGVARLKKADGNKVFATNTGKCLSTQFVGEAYFVWTGKELGDMNKFVRVDTETGVINGKQEDTYRPWFTADGNEFVKFDGNKILRYKTK